MFRRVLRASVVVITAVYVDDLLVASETKRDEEQAINDLRSCFSIKGLGEAGLYLGCHITRDRDAGMLKLDQYHYIRTMVSKITVEETSTTPAATLEGGEKATTIPVADEGHWDHLRMNAEVVHKTVGMGGRQFCHLPRHSAFGFRRGRDVGGGARSVGSRGRRR